MVLGMWRVSPFFVSFDGPFPTSLVLQSVRAKGHAKGQIWFFVSTITRFKQVKGWVEIGL